MTESFDTGLRPELRDRLTEGSRGLESVIADAVDGSRAALAQVRQALEADAAERTQVRAASPGPHERSQEGTPISAVESGSDKRSPASLLHDAANGDEQAWDILFEDYHRLVWSVARGFGLSTEDAADVSQMVWLRLVENFGRIREPDQLAAWLATVTRREALRVLRGAQREIPTADDQLVAAELIFFDGLGGLDPEALVFAEGEHAELWQAFGSLSEKCQGLLRIVAVAPLDSYAAVANELGMPVGSIGPTRMRCLAQLKRALAVDDPASS